jgi:hypothetical protein
MYYYRLQINWVFLTKKSLHEALLYPTEQVQYSTQVSGTASTEPSSHRETNAAYLSTLLKGTQHVHCNNGEAFAFMENISMKEYFRGYGTCVRKSNL